MIAYLGLGSNLRRREANIADALRRLGAVPGIKVTKRSSVIDTAPVGGPEQPHFLNAACEVETTLSARGLLRAALDIERDMGRKRGVRWGPRIIDIDILLYGESIIEEADLAVPHPRLTEREFVLRPLTEIAPDVRHPLTGRDIRSMYRALSATNAAIARRLRDKRRRKVTVKITTVKRLRAFLARRKSRNESVGLVPTMGALHEGHASLIRRSVGENDVTVVSIFVNPTQFGPREDLRKYPRTLPPDFRLARAAGADVVFAPSVREVYPEGFSTCVEVEKLTAGLCGASRPGHFRGVTTVCAKLFGMVAPDRAYFGEKDYQQLVVVRRMVADLNMNLDVVACAIVREPDGLAMSSRNAYLLAGARKQALVLRRSLLAAKQLAEKSGVRSVSRITAVLRRIIKAAPMARIDYVAVIHPDTLAPLKTVTGDAVVALAVFIHKTRLIDNIRIRTTGGR
jgi:pantoate--beta-alanine ligase